MPAPTELPYLDTKAQGAADFYFAINATFRFLIERLGVDGWKRYLRELGQRYYQPVNVRWREGGLPAVARYWREFFAAEPGGEVEVEETPDRVVIHVRVCPALKHLRAGRREIVREYCQHCYWLGSARAEAAGLQMRLRGGDGSCAHTFAKAGAGLAPQVIGEIAETRS